MKINKLFISLLILLSMGVSVLHGQKKNPKKKETRKKAIKVILADESSFMLEGRRITLGDAIRMTLKRNRDTLVGSYEVAMSDSLYRQYQKKYSPYINLGGGRKYEKYPPEMGSTVPDDMTTWDASASVAKMFYTGTTVSAGIAHEYSKSTLRPIVMPGMGSLSFGDSEYHRPVMFVSIQQELLKNFFGYSERRQEEILKNAGKMQRDALIFRLSGLVVEVIVDYWTAVINSWAVDNAELQLRETKRVRYITYNNVRLGLAEKFDLNYYNTLVAAADGKVTHARQKYRDSLRKLYRTLNMDEKTKLSNAILVNSLPEINESEALKVAYKKRVDYRNALLTLQNAEMELQMYENEGLPSVTAEFNMSSMGQRDRVPDAYSDSSKGSYPSWEARVKVTYPLDDGEQKTNERNARYKLKQAKINIDKYKREVRDDIKTRVEHIATYFKLYQKGKQARVQSEIYYRRLLGSLRRGRFTAAVIKNALDNMVESRQRELESLIQYNITLLQFDVSKNALFDRYKINVDDYLPKEK